MVTPLLAGMTIGALAGLQVIDLQQKRRQGESVKGVVINLILLAIALGLIALEHT